MNLGNVESTNEKGAQVSKKYKKIFKAHKELTVQALVKKLKLETKDPLHIKSVSQKDAVDILLMIGLSSIPFGQILKRPLIKKLGPDPGKITFRKILDSIKSITLDDINDELILALIKNTLKRTNLDNLEDPYKSTNKLKDFPATARFIRTPNHLIVAKIIGIEKEKLKKVKEKIANTEQFLTAENEQIANNFQIEINKVQLIKDAIKLIKTFDIKPKLAVILCQDFGIQDLISLNIEDIKNKINSSKVSVQKSDFADSDLENIKKNIENRNPKLVSLYKIISELKLKTLLKKYIDEHKITAIADFNKVVIDKGEKKKIIDILSSKIKSKKKIEVLNAYLRLSAISNNFELNKVLIENNFSTFHDITSIPFFEFQNKFIDKASKNELKEIYYKAQSNLAKNITRKSSISFTPKRSFLDYLVTKSNQPNFTLKKEVDEN